MSVVCESELQSGSDIIDLLEFCISKTFNLKTRIITHLEESNTSWVSLTQKSNSKSQDLILGAKTVFKSLKHLDEPINNFSIELVVRVLRLQSCVHV